MMRTKGEAPKIVQIETRYVETDASNFRDVVQSLTGKNSSTAWIGQRNSNNADASSSANSNSLVKGGTAITPASNAQQQQGARLTTDSMLTNHMPFKDFDRLLLDMPAPVEGMEGNWSWF